MSESARTEFEAAAFRRLVEHLRERDDVQNIDLMNMAGFCRNCLARWYAEAAAEQGQAIDKEDARELVYGMPYDEWKAKHQHTVNPLTRVNSAVAHNRQLIGLPPKVALFYARSRRLAKRRHDEWSLHSSTKPADLKALIELAEGRREVVEIGTGTAWTSAALALADRRREITTYDPVVRGEREWYIGLAGISVRKRVTFKSDDGETAAETYEGRPSLLYIDGSHERERTIGTFMSWRPKLAPDAIVAFHDFHNPVYPGVREAIGELGLDGHSLGEFYVWRSS